MGALGAITRVFFTECCPCILGGGLYPLLDAVSQLTRLRNKIFQYSSILSVRTFVRTVQSLVMQVGNA